MTYYLSTPQIEARKRFMRHMIENSYRPRARDVLPAGPLGNRR